MAEESGLVSDSNLDNDPLKEAYHASIVDNPERFTKEEFEHAALLVIDMQYLDAAKGWGVFSDVDGELDEEHPAFYYFDTLEKQVIPNIQKLQKFFREEKKEVIHTRIQCLTQDGRDRSPGHKRLGLLARPGSKEADFLEQVGPQGDEIVVNKTASGVFSSTNVLFLLNNLGIKSLYVVGVYTNECVSTTVRDASDLGFFVTVIEDACTTVTPHLQDSTILTLKDRYARVVSTSEAIQELREYIEGRKK